MFLRDLSQRALFVRRGPRCARRSSLTGRNLLIGKTISILLVCCAAALAEDNGKPLKLDKETSRYDLTGYLGLYEDKTGAETIDTVQAKAFSPMEQAALSLGYTRSVYWIRFVVRNGAKEPETLRLQIPNHYLDFIDIFVKSEQMSRVEHYRAGARLPFNERVSQESRPVLDLHFAPNEQKTIFVRVQSASPMRVPLVLSTPEAYGHDRMTTLFFFGVFYGVMGFVIIFNLLSWSILKQNAYFYYILELICVVTFRLANDGLVPQVSIFSQPEKILHLFTTTIALATVFYTLFLGAFFDARQRHPGLYRILDALWIVSLGIFVLYMISYYVGNIVMQLCGPIITICLIVVVGLMWKRGEAHARYFFFGNIPVPIYAVLHAGFLAGIIPFSLILFQSLQFGFLFMGLFFSLALADRYAIMQRSAQKDLETQVAERSAELVEANRKLRDERDKAQKYLDIAGVLIVALNLEGKVTLINRKGCEALEIGSDRIMGKDWFETCLPERDRARVREVYFRSVTGRIDLPEYFENPVISRSGEERLMFWHNSLIKDQSGNILGTLSSGEDITDRRRSEEALRASESKFRELTELLPQTVFEMDLNGKLAFLNRVGFQFTGYSEKDLVTGLTAFQLAVPEDRERVAEHLLRVARGEKVGSNEYTALRKDGVTFPVVVYSAPIMRNKEVVGFRGVVIDVTPLKNAEEMVRESYEKLEDYAQSLEFKVEERTRHLETARKELDAYAKKLEYANEALRNLISGTELQNRALIHKVGGELRVTVIPLLNNLAAVHPDVDTIRLIATIQDRIDSLVSSLAPSVDEEALLTPLQARLCEMIASGLSSKEIAAIMGVTPQAISFHRYHIRKKLGLTGSRDDLAHFLRNKLRGRSVNPESVHE